jgi:tRNA(Ile)-lysidine synthase
MPESQLFRICHQVTAGLPPQRGLDFPTLVAVSGGADSVALLRVLNVAAASGSKACDRAIAPSSNLAGERITSSRCVSFSEKANSIGNDTTSGHNPLIVAHINHHLRGEHSDGDEQFVRELANEQGLEFCVAHFDSTSNDPSEDNLRQFRYEALLKMAKQFGARYIATGHTRDDQIETILFRIFRGTGLNGLSGIPRLRVADETVSIIRPLLDVARSEIELLLQELGQPFRNDDSNCDSKYTRNFLRNELLPSIKSRFGSSESDSVGDALLRLSQQATEAMEFAQSQAKFPAAIVRCGPNCVELNGDAFRDQPSLLVRQFLTALWTEQAWPKQSMTHGWWQAIADAICGNDDVVLNLPGNIRMVKTGDRIEFPVEV